jgi:hypothetical protein
MDDHIISNTRLIIQCVHNAANKHTETYDDSSSISSYDDYNSLQDYLKSDAESTIDHLSLPPYDTGSISKYDTYDDTNTDDISTNAFDDKDTDVSIISEQSVNSHEAYLNGDKLPKTFLQIHGIAIGNYNMGCNFRAASAIRIMIQYNLTILAIQEHTPWNRTLSDAEITSIERHFDKWGYFVSISKLQILIIDKKISACHRESKIHNDGRIIESRFAISETQNVLFLPVYGIPHSSENNANPENEGFNENTKLMKMTELRDQLKSILNKAQRRSDIIYVMGDLQDTPDNSNTFHYGSCRIAKHPLGIVKTCENADLLCSIYHHSEHMEKPIISRHGTKGGRFIDGTYTCIQGMEKVTGITIVKDTGINSDHDLVISKLDLGIEKFQVSNE